MPKTGLLLPYTAQSPTLFKKIDFKTEKDVDDEIQRILSEPKIEDFGVGQSLYLQLPFFCNPSEQISDWCWDMIEDYKITTQYNVPIGVDVGEVNSWILDCFNVIEEETNKVTIYRQSNGN